MCFYYFVVIVKTASGGIYGLYVAMIISYVHVWARVVEIYVYLALSNTPLNSRWTCPKIAERWVDSLTLYVIEMCIPCRAKRCKNMGWLRDNLSCIEAVWLWCIGITRWENTISLLQFGCSGDGLLEHLFSSGSSLQWLGRRFFDFWWVLVCLWGHSLRGAAACSFHSQVPWEPIFFSMQFGYFSSMIAYCAWWTAVFLR